MFKHMYSHHVTGHLSEEIVTESGVSTELLQGKIGCSNPCCTLIDFFLLFLKALQYRQRIMAAVPEGSTFQPLMTLYLTDNTPPEEVERARQAGIAAFKLYPAGATTNSDSGVTSMSRIMPTLQAMARVRGQPLCFLA
jgi:hypothetical protein